jgi:hypothetical protein
MGVRNTYIILVGKSEEKKPNGRLNSNIKINIRNTDLRGCGLDSSGSVEGPMAGSCEYGNEHSVSIKGGEFLDLLSVLLAFQKRLLNGVSYWGSCIKLSGDLIFVCVSLI